MVCFFFCTGQEYWRHEIVLSKMVDLLWCQISGDDWRCKLHDLARGSNGTKIIVLVPSTDVRHQIVMCCTWVLYCHWTSDEMAWFFFLFGWLVWLQLFTCMQPYQLVWHHFSSQICLLRIHVQIPLHANGLLNMGLTPFFSRCLLPSSRILCRSMKIENLHPGDQDP